MKVLNHLSWIQMKKKWKWAFLALTLTVASSIYITWPSLDTSITPCSALLSEQTITPIINTNHLMVSAYKDHRFKGITRIIGIMKRDQLQPLYCIFCCHHSCSKGYLAHIDMHSDHFGYPFATTDVLCRSQPLRNATHVTISTHADILENQHQSFLPIRNKESAASFPYTFTVCVSNLFGGYNNVLQFVQTMEMYKLLGVQRVVIYNTSCGPELERVLLNYKDEGILEIVQWPIDHFLNPSKGWNFPEHPGDLHYYGQLVTLNECIYRNMYRSKYLLLNDIDEIIMPYKHVNLQLMMENLEQGHPGVAIFVVTNHIFPKTQFDDSGRFKLAQWQSIPGINILEHIYREPLKEGVFNPSKLIINPREVEQTSVHSVLKTWAWTVTVDPALCRIVHVRVPLQGSLTKDQLHVDKRLWDFDLVSKVDDVLRKAGLLMS
ncbi:uncharacterized protein LOC139933694 isoform X1 [Centroberyx gerrardi]